MGTSSLIKQLRAVFAAAMAVTAVILAVQYYEREAKTEKDVSRDVYFRMGTTLKLQNLHPNDGLYYSPVQSQIYSSLFAYVLNEQKTFIEKIPDLAESLEVSSDGRRCLLKLKKNVYFHNGDLFAAHDVVYTFLKHIGLLMEKFPLLSAGDFSFWAKDDFTIVGECKLPLDWGTFFAALPILNADYERRWAGKDLKTYEPMGTGPFMFSSYDTNNGILRLQRFDKYWRGKPGPIGMELVTYPNTDATLHAFLENRIDILQSLSPEDLDYVSSRATAAMIMDFPNLASYQIIFNTKNPKFADWRVRRGLSYLINRQEILKDRYALNSIGLISDAPLHYAYPITTPESEPYEPMKGKKLLEEAGYRKKNGWLEKDGKPLEMDILIPACNRGYLQVFRLIERQFAQAGVRLKIKIVANEILYEWRKRNYDMLFTESNDMMTLGVNFVRFNPGNPANLSKYSDADLDKLFHSIGYFQPAVETKRAIQNRIRDMAPVITLFYKRSTVVVRGSFAGEWLQKEPYVLYYLYEAGKEKSFAG